MFSKSTFFSLLRLYASNKTLLEIYYSLYFKLEGQDSDFHREQLSNRIALREKFRLELMQCIETNYFEKEETFIEKASTFSFPLVAQLEAAIPNSLFPDTWDRCEIQEVDNLKKYYNTLFMPDLCRNVSDLLMDQKDLIEEYLHSAA